MKREIKRSKSLRTWNKYKNLIIMGIVVLALVVALAVGIIVSVGKKSDKKDKNQTSEAETTEYTEEFNNTVIETNPFTGEPIYTESTSESFEFQTETWTQIATEPITEATMPDPTHIVKTPSNEEFNNEAFFDNAVFVGDSFVAGIDAYKYLKSNRLVYDNNWTTGKASNAAERIGATNASKVFIEIGLNDLNNGKSADKTFESYKELVDDIKAKLPNAKIYVISLFPVTSGFEARETSSVKNSEVKNLNNMLSSMSGVTYLDVAASLSNSDGSLQTDLTTSGYNIKNTYYGFILNLIVEMCQ